MNNEKIKIANFTYKSSPPTVGNKDYVTIHITKCLINSGDLDADIRQSCESIRDLLAPKPKKSKEVEK